jgi:hypothetical protein
MPLALAERWTVPRLTLSPSVESKVSMKSKYYEHLFMFIK